MSSPSIPWLSPETRLLVGLNALAIAVIFVFVMLGLLVSTPSPIQETVLAAWPIPACVFKAWTHLPCPFCGLTRSFLALLQGDLLRSFQYHVLGIPLYLFTLGFVVSSFTRPELALAVVRWCRKRQNLFYVLFGLGVLWGLKLLGDPAYW